MSKNDKTKEALKERRQLKHDGRVCHKCGKPSKGQYWCDRCRARHAGFKSEDGIRFANFTPPRLDGEYLYM